MCYKVSPPPYPGELEGYLVAKTPPPPAGTVLPFQFTPNGLAILPVQTGRQTMTNIEDINDELECSFVMNFHLDENGVFIPQFEQKEDQFQFLLDEEGQDDQ